MGAIDSNVDLSSPTFDLPGESDPGFGDEHSGEFNAPIQVLKSFYNRILEEFQIDQIP